MNTVDALRLIAMRAVVNGDSDYNIRYILRWYSKTFHTALTDVEDLPLEDVLQTFFECRYEEMNEAERDQEIEKLLLSEEELARKRRREDAEDAEAEEFAKLTETQVKENNKKPLENAAKTADKVATGLQKLAETLQEEKVEVQEPESPIKVLPDIKMTFIEDTDFDQILEGSFGPPPKKPG